MEEDELGIPVTTKHHIKIPPRYSTMFEVNLHRNCEGTKIISANRQLMEVNPNAFQHKISLKPDGDKYFPVIAITNLDHAKMLHLAKGEIVGFAHDEEVEMHYIETTNIMELEEIEQKALRNVIPEEVGENAKNSMRSCHNMLKYHKLTAMEPNQARSHQKESKNTGIGGAGLQRMRSRGKNHSKKNITTNVAVKKASIQIS